MIMAKLTSSQQRLMIVYLLGLEYARLCDYQAAIMQYTSAIEIDGEFANAYISRGENYNNLGIYELAFTILILLYK